MGPARSLRFDGKHVHTSMAAYAAKAGLRAIVLVPKRKIATGKLLQAMVHGAKITQVEGNFDRALEGARRWRRVGADSIWQTR